MPIKFQRTVYLLLYSPFAGLRPLFRFFIFYTDDRIPWTGAQPIARPLPTRRTTQTQNKRIETSMPRMGFEPTIQCSSERRVHVLDRAGDRCDRCDRCDRHFNGQHQVKYQKTELFFQCLQLSKAMNNKDTKSFTPIYHEIPVVMVSASRSLGPNLLSFHIAFFFDKVTLEHVFLRVSPDFPF
jgi:hypothetical protein